MTTLCDSSIWDETVRRLVQPKRSLAKRDVQRAGVQQNQVAMNDRVCWNCAGYMRLKESCCPRCGAARQKAGGVTTWQVSAGAAGPGLAVLKVAGFLISVVGGAVWLAMRTGM